MSATTTAVLFDLDGTLSASEPGIVGSLVTALEGEGLSVPSAEMLRSVIGPPFSVGLPAIGVPVDRVDAVIERYRMLYRGGGLYDTELYDGVAGLLDQLMAAGIRLAVATSKPEDSAIQILERLGIADRFEAIAGADVVLGLMHKSAVIARALDLLAVEAGPGVVMVGDRRHDIEGAREHGIITIAVEWGYGSSDEHRIAGAFATAATPADVARLLIS